MMNYEAYKEKVYDIFKERCLTDLSEKEKLEYLKENEDTIKKAYNGDVYSYDNLDMKNVFTDANIYSRVCANLEELY